MLKKSPENPDGRTDEQTDGRTLPRQNMFVFQMGVYKLTNLQQVFERQNNGFIKNIFLQS